MQARFIHHCIHVMDKEASIAFYEKALGLKVLRESGPDDGSWTNTFIGNETTAFELELTWNRGFDGEYENAGKDVHIAFRVPDFDEAYRLHSEMGCIARENKAMGLYFITDPDGQWIEILPEE
jgi:lactoylglutathione lyase